MYLNQLPLNTNAKIIAVKKNTHQLRMRDLGFVVGVEIVCLFDSPLKDPRLYRLLQTSVALRNEDAKNVIVEVIA